MSAAASRARPPAAEALLRFRRTALDLAQSERARKLDALREVQREQRFVTDRIAAVQVAGTGGAEHPVFPVLLEMRFEYLRQLSALRTTLDERERAAASAHEQAIEAVMERHREIRLLERYVIKQQASVRLISERRTLRFLDDAWLHRLDRGVPL